MVSKLGEMTDKAGPSGSHPRLAGGWWPLPTIASTRPYGKLGSWSCRWRSIAMRS